MSELPVPWPKTGAEVALPTDLVDRARGLADAALSPRTKQAYGSAWRAFESWCGIHGRQALPASAATLAGYVTHLAGGDGKPKAISTITQALAAIRMRHQLAGAPLDLANPAFVAVWKGARREIAARRSIRRVSPILSEDLRDVLDGLDPGMLRDARDGALLALGWGAARRRSELVGLDYLQLGAGTGVLRLDERGAVLELMTSKASQDTAETFVIGNAVAPFLVATIEAWLDVAKIAPGEPVFRPIRNVRGAGAVVLPSRLTARSVPNIVRSRLYRALKAQNDKKPKRRRLSSKELRAQVAAYSSHSMRAGFVTDALERGVADHAVMDATGHRTRSMLAVYGRVTDRIRKSPLRGAGL